MLGAACVTVDDRDTVVGSAVGASGSGASGSGSGGGSGTGGSCVATGDVCSVNGDCCNFLADAGYCVDSLCADSCTTGSECVSGCCAPLAGDVGSVCSAPVYCPPGGSAAIGDPCSLDTDCGEGTCTGLWCTWTCTTNTDCPGDNWCLLSGADIYNCFPGCAADSSKCLDYPGTTCVQATTVDAYDWSVCAVP
jgi:hypothetical protein